MSNAVSVDHIDQTVVDIVAEITGLPREQIQRESVFIEDLPMDSLDRVEMAMKVEETFQLNIPDEDVDKIKSVGDLIDYVKPRIR